MCLEKEEISLKLIVYLYSIQAITKHIKYIMEFSKIFFIITEIRVMSLNLFLKIH